MKQITASQWELNPGPLGQQASAKPTEIPGLHHID